jgi:hypothetical protein
MTRIVLAQKLGCECGNMIENQIASGKVVGTKAASMADPHRGDLPLAAFLRPQLQEPEEDMTALLRLVATMGGVGIDRDQEIGIVTSPARGLEAGTGETITEGGIMAGATIGLLVVMNHKAIGL